jgi:hypothetical protein
MDRSLFQTLLEELLGSNQVYFQPPPNVAMKYPAIVYERNFANVQFADNSPYRRTKRYSVTVIDQDPDSVIPDKVAGLPMSQTVRHFTAGNLHHDVFDIYF